MKRGWTGEEMLNSELEEPPVLMESLVWKGDNIILLGDAKTGKSLLALQMMCALTSGKPFLDQYKIAETGNVLMIQAEGKMYESTVRYKRMAEEVKSDPKCLRWLYLPSIPMDRDESAKDMIELIGKEFGTWKPSVFFIDPLYTLASKGSLRDDEVAIKITTNLNKIREHYEATIILNHHEHRTKRTDKGEKIHEGDNSIFGSFVWRAWPDHIIRFVRDTKTTRKLSCHTQRSGNVVEDLRLFFNQPKPLYFEILEDTTQAEHLIYKVIEKAGTVHVGEIPKLLPIDYSESTIFKSLRKLVKNKRLKKLDERGSYGILGEGSNEKKQ